MTSTQVAPLVPPLHLPVLPLIILKHHPAGLLSALEYIIMGCITYLCPFHVQLQACKTWLPYIHMNNPPRDHLHTSAQVAVYMVWVPSLILTSCPTNTSQLDFLSVYSILCADRLHPYIPWSVIGLISLVATVIWHCTRVPLHESTSLCSTPHPHKLHNKWFVLSYIPNFARTWTKILEFHLTYWYFLDSSLLSWQIFILW